ncbi:MAG: hypothetical protein ACYCSJ_05900 [Acidimicrobiales bacterium]
MTPGQSPSCVGYRPDGGEDIAVLADLRRGKAVLIDPSALRRRVDGWDYGPRTRQLLSAI